MNKQTTQTSHLVAFDRKQLRGYEGLIGVDEVGRGCLAGSVVAGAVYVSKKCYRSEWIRRAGQLIDDSKKLTPKQRNVVVEQCERRVEKREIIVGIGSASVEEIEQFNILGATMIAMRRALAELGTHDWLLEQKILLDGKSLRNLGWEHRAIVKGDGTSFAIALASIFAKEKRDAWMAELSEKYPSYAFERNMGYGTKTHLEALKKGGPCDIHRSLFLRKILSKEKTVESSSSQQTELL